MSTPCGMSFKCPGEGNYRLVGIQARPTVPSPGDMVELPVDDKPVRGRVVNVAAPPPGKTGVFYVDVDEVVDG